MKFDEVQLECFLQLSPSLVGNGCLAYGPRLIKALLINSEIAIECTNSLT